MNVKRTALLALVLMVLTFGLAFSQGAGNAAAEKPLTFVTCVKASGFNWFNRMEEGVKLFAQDTGITAYQQGPSAFDAALQNAVMADIIAQNVDAICISPFQPEAMIPELQKAKDKGIVLIAQEASNITDYIDYNIEAFQPEDYGRHLMDLLAEGMDYEGEYVVFVGSLGSTAHMAWVTSAIEYQKTEYPDMKLVGDINESGDTIERSYARMNELLKTYPNIKGMQGSSAFDVVGAGQAVEEAGLNDQVTVVGTSLVSYCGDLLKTGAVDVATVWDPLVDGYVMNTLAKLVVDGEPITDGMDLGVDGYNEVVVKGKNIYGQAWVDITVDNMDEYNF